MRRLPPSHPSDEKSLWSRHAPKALGLVIGLMLGYLLFPGSPDEPAVVTAKSAPGATLAATAH